jgi:hypothetical protein
MMQETYSKKKKVFMGKNPSILITDGLPAYHDAYKKELFTLKKPRTGYINTIKMSGDKNLIVVFGIYLISNYRIKE